MPDKRSSLSQPKYVEQQGGERVLKTTEEFDCERRGYKLTKSCLGTGAYAKVKLAYASNAKLEKDKRLADELKEKGTNKVAIKIISRKHAPKEYINKFMPREIETLHATYRSANVIQLYETFRTESRVYLVMEYASKGDLLEYINSRSTKVPGIGETKAKIFFKQLVAGVLHCHRRNVVHRDLKCENILIDDEDETIKISDFGFATRFPTNKQKLLETFCGSYAYAAPEILQAEKYDGKVADIWSLGIILFAMINGRLPYNDRDIRTLIEQTKTKPRFSSRVNVTEACQDLICKILASEGSERATLTEIMRHSWMSDDNKSSNDKPRGIPDGKSDEIVANETEIANVAKYNTNSTTATTTTSTAANKKIIYQPYTQRVLQRERWMAKVPEPQAMQKLLHQRTNKSPDDCTTETTPQTPQVKHEVISNTQTEELLSKYWNEKRMKNNEANRASNNKPALTGLLPNKYQPEPVVTKIGFAGQGVKTKVADDGVETTYRLSPNKTTHNSTTVAGKKGSIDRYLAAASKNAKQDICSLPPVNASSTTHSHKSSSAPAQCQTQQQQQQRSPDEFKATQKHRKQSSAVNNKQFKTKPAIQNFHFNNPAKINIEVVNLRRNWQKLKQNAGVQSPTHDLKNTQSNNVGLTYYTLSGKEVSMSAGNKQSYVRKKSNLRYKR